ncbi:MAG TPA: nuclear transport factor 2 family protein [Mucilaginibacter sp.]
MKRIPLSLLIALAVLFIFSVDKASAQDKAIHQKDMIGDNSTADQDDMAVANFTNWLVGGDADKAATLLAPDFKAYGPAPSDSGNTEQLVKGWKENYKTQSDRKVNFVLESFHVKSGDYMGNWVAVWGDYTFTSMGKTVKFPYHCVYKVTKGKINSSRIYFDNLYIVQQLGYKVTPPAGSN